MSLLDPSGDISLSLRLLAAGDLLHTDTWKFSEFGVERLFVSESVPGLEAIFAVGTVILATDVSVLEFLLSADPSGSFSLTLRSIAGEISPKLALLIQGSIDDGDSVIAAEVIGINGRLFNSVNI